MGDADPTTAHVRHAERYEISCIVPISHLPAISMHSVVLALSGVHSRAPTQHVTLFLPRDRVRSCLLFVCHALDESCAVRDTCFFTAHRILECDSQFIQLVEAQIELPEQMVG